MEGRSSTSLLRRKPSGILKGKDVPIISSIEVAPTLTMDPSAPRDTLSLKCPCGYIKRDVMCIGDVVDKDQKLYHFCGGLFILVSNAMIECSRCRKTSSRLSYTCPFCSLESDVHLTRPLKGQAFPVWPRIKKNDKNNVSSITDRPTISPILERRS